MPRSGVATGEVWRRHHERAAAQDVWAEGDVLGCQARGDDAGRVQSQRLSDDLCGERQSAEQPFLDRFGEGGVGLASELVPHAGRCRGSPRGPCQRRRRGVVAGADQRGDLVADLRVRQLTGVHERRQQVAFVEHGIVAPVGDLLVDDRIDPASVLANTGAAGERERVRHLPDGGRLEVGLGAFEQLAELVEAGRQPTAEQGLHHHGHRHPPSVRRQIDRPVIATSLGEQPSDRGIGLVDDRRHPAVQPPSGEGGEHRASSPPVVVAVGHQHRLVADDEPEHVQRM